jgi:hypothetical protein
MKNPTEHFRKTVQMLKSYEMILKIGSVQNMVYLKGRVSLVEQELLTLPEQLSYIDISTI